MNGRVVAVLSRFDVASGVQGQNPYDCRGYAIGSARQIAVNVVLQLLAKQRSDTRPLPPAPPDASL
jgi:hypothetical protein